MLVDDEYPILEMLRENFLRDGYDVISATTGTEALRLAEEEHPQLIVLDCMLPEMSGFDVCRIIRQHSQVPILMLTAKSEEIDKVLGLELGADDYITKPFSIRELLARVKALLRRSFATQGLEEGSVAIRFGNGELIVDPAAYEVRLRGVNCQLTLREFELVYFLAQHAGQVFSREALMEAVWGSEYLSDVRTVDVTVRRIREKIEPVPGETHYLMTKRRVGYFWQRDSQRPQP